MKQVRISIYQDLDLLNKQNNADYLPNFNDERKLLVREIGLGADLTVLARNKGIWSLLQMLQINQYKALIAWAVNCGIYELSTTEPPDFFRHKRQRQPQSQPQPERQCRSAKGRQADGETGGKSLLCCGSCLAGHSGSGNRGGNSNSNKKEQR
ncbi:unnamed protein product [Ceratitis capitata]|uniref:(Mediterranean fruit fly) hypothetical protein n=1 Tax=Ceratitis capitata TaxID=7213 RepID=A0A811VDJ3_CERCA|nr:unnamed protein product [Ceratitis capitata]